MTREQLKQEFEVWFNQTVSRQDMIRNNFVENPYGTFDKLSLEYWDDIFSEPMTPEGRFMFRDVLDEVMKRIMGVPHVTVEKFYSILNDLHIGADDIITPDQFSQIIDLSKHD